MMQIDIEFKSHKLNKKGDVNVRYDGLDGKWKQVEDIRYMMNFDGGGFGERDVAVASWCRGKRHDARLYALMKPGQIHPQRRVKNKLIRVETMRISTRGGYAVASFPSENCFKIFDLRVAYQPVLYTINFPEYLLSNTAPTGKKASKKKKIPNLVGVSNEGRRVIVQTVDGAKYGQLWIWDQDYWFLLLKDVGGANSVDVAFRSELVVEIKLVFIIDEHISFHYYCFERSSQGYESQASHVYSMKFHIPESKMAVSQCWNPINSFSAIHVTTIPPDGKRSIPKGDDRFSSLIFHRPFCNIASVLNIVEILRLDKTVEICDMSFTADGLFLAIALTSGAISLITYFGQKAKIISTISKSIKWYPVHIRNAIYAHVIVEENFKLCTHPDRAEITLCDGNGNMVHILLPTDKLIANQPTSRMIPILAAVEALVDRDQDLEATQGFRITNDSLLENVLVAWGIAMSTPYEASPTRQEIVKTCSQHVSAMITSYASSHDEINTCRVLAMVLGLSRMNPSIAPELAYVVRTVGVSLINQRYFFAAIKLLCMAEDTFQQPLQPTKHVHFDRTWLYLAAAAMEVDSVVGIPSMAMIQERARKWASLRNETSRKRSEGNACDDSVPAEVRPKLWRGHDFYLRGHYRSAINAYRNAGSSGFSCAICVLLREYEIEEALELGVEALHRLHSSPKKHLGLTILADFLEKALIIDHEDFILVPSPSANATPRMMKPVRVEFVRAHIDAMNDEMKSQLLEFVVTVRTQVRPFDYSMASKLLEHSCVWHALPKIIKSLPSHSKTRIDVLSIYQRQLATYFCLGQLDIVMYFIWQIADKEADSSILTSILWQCLKFLHLESAQNPDGVYRTISNFCNRCVKQDMSPGLEPLIYVGHATLCMLHALLSTEKEGITYENVFDISNVAPVVVVARAVVYMIFAIESGYHVPPAFSKCFLEKGSTPNIFGGILPMLADRMSRQLVETILTPIPYPREPYIPNKQKNEIAEEPALPEAISAGEEVPNEETLASPESMDHSAELELDIDSLSSSEPSVGFPEQSDLASPFVSSLHHTMLEGFPVLGETDETDESETFSLSRSVSELELSSSEDSVSYTSPWIFEAPKTEIIMQPATMNREEMDAIKIAIQSLHDDNALVREELMNKRFHLDDIVGGLNENMSAILHQMQEQQQHLLSMSMIQPQSDVLSEVPPSPDDTSEPILLDMLVSGVHCAVQSDHSIPPHVGEPQYITKPHESRGHVSYSYDPVSQFLNTFGGRAPVPDSPRSVSSRDSSSSCGLGDCAGPAVDTFLKNVQPTFIARENFKSATDPPAPEPAEDEQLWVYEKEIPGMPKLLSIHPGLRHIARHHEHRPRTRLRPTEVKSQQASVRTDCKETQSNIPPDEVPHVPVDVSTQAASMEVDTQTVPVTVDVSSVPTPIPMQPVTKTPAATDTMSLADSATSPEDLPPGEVCIPLCDPRAVASLPVVLPHLPPDVYLTMISDPNKHMKLINRNPVKRFLHVASLSSQSVGVDKHEVSTKPRRRRVINKERVVTPNKYRASFVGTVADKIPNDQPIQSRKFLSMRDLDEIRREVSFIHPPRRQRRPSPVKQQAS